ncbi:MAG: hypothetical protein AAF799_45125 [Myxococcota bacterium]
MTRTRLGLLVSLAALGVGTTACVVPVELAQSPGTESDSEAMGNASADESGTEGDTADCLGGELGCVCVESTCEDGLTCAEGECVPLQGPCGNGLLEDGEDCDDGNLTDADGCNADCRVSGTIEWSVDLNGDADLSGILAVGVDSTDAIVLGGFFSQDDVVSGRLWKLDPAGEELWVDTMAETTVVRELAIAPDDGIAVAGFSNPTSPTSTEIWVRDYDTDGTLEQQFEPDWNIIEGVAVLPDGRILAGGGGRLFAMDSEPPWHWELEQWFNVLTISPTGGFVVAGWSTEELDMSYIAWYEDTTNPGTATRTQIEPKDPIRGLAFDSEGNIVVVGSRTVGATSSASELRKLAPDGAELWSITPTSGSPSGERAFGMAVDSRDRIVVVGYGDSDLDYFPWIAKFDSDGTPLWNVVLTENLGDIHGIAINSQDEVLVGTSYGEHAVLFSLTP